MNAEYTDFSPNLEPNVQYEVPIYQRMYDWEPKHCRRLYDDIVKAGIPNGLPHFIGAITCVGGSIVTPRKKTPFEIIDGQQRITTIMLLLRALRDVVGDSTDVTKSKIDQLLFNHTENEHGDKYHKLILGADDNDALKEIMRRGNSESSSNVVRNFKNFVKWMKESSVNPKTIWDGIQKLTVVLIVVDRNDDPQSIFESMNSTGLDLSATDMIKNHFLMGKDPEWQKNMFTAYWKPMEKRFGLEQNDYFEDFVRHYLGMQKKGAVSKKEIYEYFKFYIKDRNKEEELERMYEYSKYYSIIVGLFEHSSKKTDAALKRIRSQYTNVANSFLLKLLSDHKDGKITAEDCENVLILVDSYLLRRYVCDIGKGSNKIFPEMISKIDENNYLESVKEELMSKSGNGRFPRDVVFRERLENLPLYLNRSMCKYVLARLVNSEQAVQIDPDTATIEHIMPQQLSEEWKRDLGSDWEIVYDKYLHAIGNLTLLGQPHNSELGNKPFPDKRSVYEKSNVGITQKLGKYESWGRDEIEKRTKELIDSAVKIWKIPPGYGGVDASIESEPDESDYLEGKDSADLWYKLKKGIGLSCPGVIFGMRKHYGAFNMPIESKGVLCSIEAMKTKLKFTYNVKISDHIIGPSPFLKDMSDIGHLGPGEWQSIIMTEDDIDKAVKLIKIVYDNKP